MATLPSHSSKFTERSYPLISILECIYCLTQLSGGYILHREQLHVSALDYGHHQVVYETLSKQLYRTCIWATYIG